MEDARGSNYIWKQGGIVRVEPGPDLERPTKPDAPRPGPGAVDAEEVLRRARAEAAERGKKVLVHAGFPTCGWCRVLDAFLEANKGLFANGYVVVKIDTEEMAKGAEVADRLRDGHAGGFPWIGVLDPGGRVLATSDRPTAQRSAARSCRTKSRTSWR